MAGVVADAARLVLVDEGSALTPVHGLPGPSHLRGVVGHATFGLAVGTLLSLIERR